MVGTTAFVNDDEPDRLCQQVVALANSDLLLAISTSGNSQSVSCSQSRQTWASGRLANGSGRRATRSTCEIMIKFPPAGSPAGLHLPVYHTLCQVVEDTLFP